MNANLNRLQNYVIALNLPVFPEKRKVQFQKVLAGILQKSDPSITVDCINVPIKDEVSQGFAFIKCQDYTAARNLVATADYLQLDKNSKELKKRARLILCETYKQIINDNYPKPTLLDVKPPPHPLDKFKHHLNWFLVEPRLFDQIVYTQGKIPHAVYFNHTNATLEEMDLSPDNNSADDFLFSPDGAFLVTKTQDKLNFYCSEDWMQFSVLSYPKLTNYFYSPSGLYMILQNLSQEHDNQNNPFGATVFDLMKSSIIRKFSVDKPPSSAISGTEDYPKVTNTIEFGCGDIIIYQNKEMRLFYPPEFSSKDSKSIDQVFDRFCPSMAHKILFTFRTQVQAAPPRITFYNTETFEQIYTIPKYNTNDAICFWHPTLAVCAVIAITKDKRSLLIYDLRAKNILSFNDEGLKGSVITCAWDPQEDNLCCAAIVKESGSSQIRLYKVNKNLKTFSVGSTGGSTIQYSPGGRFAVVYDGKSRKDVRFYDMENGLIKSLPIEGFDSITWDPSGVFIMVSFYATASSRSSNAKFSIYLFDGSKVLSKQIPDCRKCLWRPRITKIDAQPQDVEVPEKLLDETMHKFGRFGAVDKKTLEEEKKQTQYNQMETFLQFQSVAQYRPNIQKNEAVFTVSIPPASEKINYE
ncbi:Translation initiation factor 3 subunit b [Tritrichomonas musculus]|uniref:Translation initiation factor 3 subunit b n=1 Tax=Tritrichomonas musculus TaxID=1915356 RepID=A0ABR2KGX2_9EUKA